MAVNRDKVKKWDKDIATSVDMYNKWFTQFAPQTYLEKRVQTTKEVEATLETTSNLTNISIDMLKENPGILPTLRMCTSPPLAADRLIGLARVKSNLVKTMEKEHQLPPKITRQELDSSLQAITETIQHFADPEIFSWLKNRRKPSKQEIYRAATIVADRLTGARADPEIRNAQEKRQTATLKAWLEQQKYEETTTEEEPSFRNMKPGTFGFQKNVPVIHQETKTITNMPIDAVIMAKNAKSGDLPLMVEAKSAGDFANVNKRRKEEATKMRQLKETLKVEVPFILFLCGYFNETYLTYEANEGIDWVWEHRIDDLRKFGL